MEHSYHAWAGRMAGLLSLAGFVPYLIAILRKKAQPSRATWIIWFVVGLLLLTSYRAAGATHTLWASLANAVFCGTIAVFSFQYGEKGWSVFDSACLVAAGFALALWWMSHSPLPTLYLSILIDLIGALPTFIKSYKKPSSEDHLTWLIFFMANTINLFAIEKATLALASYPIYLFLISGIMLLMLTKKKIISE